MKMRHFFGTALSLALICSAPAVCLAEEYAQDAPPPLQVGPVIVAPSLALRETYTDNVFATATDTKSDWVLGIAPAVTVRFPFRMHELALDAGADIQTYANYTSENISPWNIAGRGSFLIGDRLSLKVSDNFQRLFETAYDSPTGKVEAYDSNAAAISVKYAFVDVAQAQLDYTHTTVRYDDADQEYRSRDEGVFSAYLYYRVQPRTSTFLEYDYSNFSYLSTGSGSDSDVQSGSVGAIWEYMDKSKGTAKIGFASKNFKDASKKDFSTWTGSLEMRHEITELASVRLSAMRYFNEGKYQGTRYYTTTGALAEFSYKFLDRLVGLANAGYFVDEFSDPNPGDPVTREDKTTKAGVGARYSFKDWLECALRYTYTNRDSNIPHYSAKENAVTFEITARR
jgi:hypothetical protein